jgi:hypothetical protein
MILFILFFIYPLKICLELSIGVAKKKIFVYPKTRLGFGLVVIYIAHAARFTELTC